MKTLKSLNKNRALLIMMLPCLLYFLFFNYMPMFGIITAFKDFNFRLGILGSKWTGLENFKFLFYGPDGFLITRNTICYQAVFLLTNCCFQVMLAIIFSMLGTTLMSKVNQTIIIMPHFLSWVIGSYFVFGILSPSGGLLNTFIAMFGKEAVNWYQEPKYWPYILWLCNTWKAVGWGSIIYYSRIRGFDPTLYEAAKVDGATWWQCVRHITFPQLISTVCLLMIMDIGQIMNTDFGLFYIVPRSNGALFDVTQTVNTYVFRGIKSGADLGGTAAASLYQSAVGCILLLVTNAIIRKIEPDNALF